MPLVKASLKAELESAFSDSHTPAEAADILSTAIDNYIRSMTITVPAGIPVATPAGAGATSANGIGVIS